MKKYLVSYYNNSVMQDILALPDTIVAKYLSLTNLMINYGANLGMPHTKSLGGGLFELRLKGMEGIARVFYCTAVGREIVILHSFIKKTDKIPSKELKIAKTRLRELQHEKS